MLLTVATPCVVDLGATAKARVVDRIANRIVDLDVADGALVSIGGDIATSGTPPESGWPITVSESARSLKRERVFAEISIVGGAVATSSTVVRTWGEGGDLHHLIDPSTGRSASSPWRQVTVLAPTCLAANVAATAAHLQGEDALEILAEAGLGALVISRDFEVFEIGSWPRSST
jgi:thiamine biosynthesis lipoprotein